MPRNSEYQPLPQNVDEERQQEDLEAGPPSLPANRRLSKRLRRARAPGHIDLKKLDVAFKRWTENIAQKVKGKKKVESDASRKEIIRSVFGPPVPSQPISDTFLKTLDHRAPMSQTDFDRISLSVQAAILEGIHPKMITKGSSGSYFARAKVDGKVQTVAVFKPKDEEPYGRLNPKTTKWLHRQFRWLIPFGRACLIPNLSYISEAAASLMDDRLGLNIVPKTQLVSLSSSAFFYDWLDRNAAKKGKPLPEKIGSMQCFMHGYTDASDFLRKHPWPGRSLRDTFDDSTHRTKKYGGRFLTAMRVICGKTGAEDDDGIDEYEDENGQVLWDASEAEGERPFYWSNALQQSFREELEKLVILDYIIHNTDRGADNYMIKYCDAEHEKSLVDVAPTRSSALQMPQMGEFRRDGLVSTPPMSTPAMTPNINGPSSSPQTTPMVNAAQTPTPKAARTPNERGQPLLYTRYPHIHIAAIDNSLAFPHEHPRGWRSYTYGWLYLPVSIIGQPFSQKTRDHFLPLLTSKEWWEETTYQLRKLFSVDPDFNRKMFQRQLAVIKGQAYNIVQSLRHHDEGPLELTRRQNVLVWDDELVVPDDETESIRELLSGPLSATTPSRPIPNTGLSSSSDPPSNANKPTSPPLVGAPPIHRRSLSHSALDASTSQSYSTDPKRTFLGFPPPARQKRPNARPVPFASKLPRVHPGTTGVTVLEHMERVDAVEERLRRLAVDPDGGDFAEGNEEEQRLLRGEERETDIGVVRPSGASGVASGSGSLGERDGTSPRKRIATILEDDDDDLGDGDGDEIGIKVTSEDEDADGEGDGFATPTATSPFISPISPAISLPADRPASISSSMTEDDIAALSLSTSALDRDRSQSQAQIPGRRGGRGGSGSMLTAADRALARLRVQSAESQTPGTARVSLDWIREEEESGRRRVVVSERVEVVEGKALCTCW